MLNKFNKICNEILNNDFLLVENIENIYEKANNILYETNSILPCPKHLFEIVKTNILNLIKNKDYKEKQINLKEALNDEFIINQDDVFLTKTLFELFKNHKNAFFNIKIEGTESFYFDKRSEYILPKGFTENLIDESTLHYSYPKIKPLELNNKILNNFIKEYQRDVEFLKTIYERQQKALKLFKKNILNFNDFGTIVIYPWNCAENSLNVNLPTLDEAIEHECQHLCIFLLSLAKTCIYIGLHFSNNIKKSSLLYQLKANEFITLTGSYCNILIRIYKKIEEPKNINEFIKAVIELSIYEKTDQNKKYVDALYSSEQFSRIKEFYKEIWKDSKFGAYKKEFKNNELIKIPLTKITPNEKFKKLLNWTLKNFENNFKN